MSNKGFKLMLATAVLGIAAITMPLSAQPGGGGGPGGMGGGPGGAGGPGGGGQGGRGNPQQRILTALTNNAGASADDITKITPLLTAVQTAQANSTVRAAFGRAGGGGGPGGGAPGGGAPGGGGAPAQSELQIAIAALNTTLADANATPDDLKTKLKAVRDAKAKALEELKKAQKALADVLNPKEEAVLVAQGILE